jgi:hypothetical protein
MGSLLCLRRGRMQTLYTAAFQSLRYDTHCMNCNFAMVLFSDNGTGRSRLILNTYADCESGVYAPTGALLRLRRGRMRTLYAAVFRSLPMTCVGY